MDLPSEDLRSPGSRERPVPWMRWGLQLLTVLPFLLVGVVVWKVFFPASMPYDAVNQFGQAWTGTFYDWHPPLMAVILRLFLKVGRSVGALALVLCLAMLLGLRALSIAWLRAFFGLRFPPLWAGWIAVLVMLLLILPLSPLVFYLMTFWKDSWSALILLWICAVSFQIVSEPPEGGGKRLHWLRVLVLLALSAAFGLVRHNALVVLPFVGLVLWDATRRISRKLAVGLLLAPLAAFVVSEVVLYRMFDIQRSHLEVHLAAFDLVGVCARDAEVCEEIPLIRQHILVPNLRERYVPGNIVYSFWVEPHILDPAVYGQGRRLAVEYLRTAWRHPVLLAKVKYQAFHNLLGFVGPYVYYYHGIVENEYGLRPNERFAPVRTRLDELLQASASHRYLRLFSAVHMVWIAANVVWIVVLLASPRRRLALVLLLPLVFYLSYLGSTPAADYRFMYPSTLTLQVLTLAWVFGLPVRWWAARSGPPGSVRHRRYPRAWRRFFVSSPPL